MSRMKKIEHELKLFFELLAAATQKFEHHVREQSSSVDQAPLLETIAAAKRMYTSSAGLVIKETTELTDGCVAEIHRSGWLNKAQVDQEIVYYFMGPLTGSEDFQRLLSYSSSGGVFFTLNSIVPLPYGKAGDQWEFLAHSRDENHDFFRFNIEAIYSLGRREGDSGSESGQRHKEIIGKRLPGG